MPEFVNDTLVAIGIKTCTFAIVTPSQTAGSEYLNIDEGMAIASTTDFIEATVVNQVLEPKLGTVSFTGEFGSMRLAFDYAGEVDPSFPNGPAADATIYLDGVAVATTKRFDLDTEDAESQGAWTWTQNDFLQTLTGDIWNNATERTVRFTAKPAAKGTDDPPVPWLG